MASETNSEEQPRAEWSPDHASDPLVRDSVEWPTGTMLVRQLAIVAGVLVIWGGTFSVAMRLPTESASDIAAEERREARRAAAMEREAAGGDEAGAAGEAAGTTVEVARTGAPASAGDPEGTSSAVTGTGDERVATAEGGASTSDGNAATSDGAAPPPGAGSSSASAASGTSEATSTSDRASASAPSDPDDPIAAMVEEERTALVPDVSDHPPVDFATDVLPILERRCIDCHGGMRDDGSLRIEEGLDLRTVDAILAGSTWGSVVEPGDPVASYMLELILEGDMPDEGPRLLPAEIRTITAWIAQGAGR